MSVTGVAEGILEGAVDLHRHGYPEISRDLRPPISDAEDIALCRDAGMRAVALKSHVWPTTGRAYLLDRSIEGITVIGSVTLNRFAGGVSPDVVELAVKQGAGIVHLPTASSASDLEREGISKRIADVIDHFDPASEIGTRLLGDDGRLSAETGDLLDVLDEFPVTVYSGHISVGETFALLETGRLADRFVFAHPDSHSIGAQAEQIREAARLGAFIEICALGVTPEIARITHEGLAGMIRLVGAERCIATSDYFFPWNPPSSTMLQDLADGLAAAGITRRELELVFRDNPAQLVADHLSDRADLKGHHDAPIDD